MISNCIFTWGFTSPTKDANKDPLLWIDFKLYFYVRIHKSKKLHLFTSIVVNWFQIVFLREDSQESLYFYTNHNRCELISNCIFTWGFTRVSEAVSLIYKLWIDFKLYFYVRIHKVFSLRVVKSPVVNWFQIVFLREDSQEKNNYYYKPECCELISNCIFTWGFTSFFKKCFTGIKLWIDFKLYFYVRIHKINY